MLFMNYFLLLLTMKRYQVAFSDYILAKLIENDNRYPPHLWAAPPLNERRTTNGPELYHRHLKD
jgi:hypothetical protein